MYEDKCFNIQIEFSSFETVRMKFGLCSNKNTLIKRQIKIIFIHCFKFRLEKHTYILIPVIMRIQISRIELIKTEGHLKNSLGSLNNIA